ncbi:MAG: hypothetical protein WC205_19070 [Opitutaceae bacterium]|jgi:hypothetical protein
MDAKQLLQAALAKIPEASVTGDIRRITELTKIASRAKEIDAELSRFQEEIQTLFNAVLETHEASITPPPSQQAVRLPELIGPLAIEIDWHAIGKSVPKLTICERQASDTLRRLIEELFNNLGPEILEKLSQLKINRGPLISKNPEREFLNAKSRRSYAHQRISRTEYSVLTHSATPEKIAAIIEVRRMLGLPVGSIRAFEVSKEDQIKALTADYLN